ncbi:dienelactone hydrolase family protein [Comamonadaceae bacterium PP-2]
MPRLPIEIETGPEPTAAIIIMHGLGADGSDFVPVAQELDLGAVGHVRYVFPYAPVIPVTINGGYQMPAWYDILGADLVRREDEGGLRSSRTLIDGLVEEQIARGIPSERIVVAGFSQGCAMALMTGLRSPHRLAGIVGLSGYLPLADTTAAERHVANQDTPIFLAAGEYDGIVRMERASASRDALTALGYTVDWHTYPMEHSVCREELADLQAWLLKVLG